MQNEITHDTDIKKFIFLNEGRVSHLDYELKGDSMDVTHTFVDPRDRGQGIAEALVLNALKFAEVSGYKVIPSCSYVEVFIKRHPRWQFLVS